MTQSRARKTVCFDQNHIQSGISKIGNWEMQGGGFWNRIRTLDIKEIEEKAFDRILAFAYVEKYHKSTAYDDVRRVQSYRQTTGDQLPKFTHLLMRIKEKSVIDNVYFHNAINDKEVVYRLNSIKTSHFDLIQSDKIRLRQPIDFTNFLQLKPLKKEDMIASLSKSSDVSPSMMKDALLKDIIDRTPFFVDVENFKKDVDQINYLSYIKRAYVHYIFAEYYGQVFYRSASLYNVEMMTYYASLFSGFEMKLDTTLENSDKNKLDMKIKRLKRIRESLKKGETSKDIVNALAADSNIAYSGLVDPAFGVPLDSPLLLRRNGLNGLQGGAWPFRKKDAKPDFSKLKLRSVVQMAELMLNEPLVEERDIVDSNKMMKQTFLLKAYEPILSTDLADIPNDSIDKSLMYIEDVKAKMLIAMREVRKNILLNAFHSSTNPEDSGFNPVMEKLQKDFDIRASHSDASRRHASIENGFDDIFEQVFKPARDKLNQTVNANIATASKNIQNMKISKTSSFLGASDLFLSASDLSPWGGSSRVELPFAELSPLSGETSHPGYFSRFNNFGRKVPI